MSCAKLKGLLLWPFSLSNIVLYPYKWDCHSRGKKRYRTIYCSTGRNVLRLIHESQQKDKHNSDPWNPFSLLQLLSSCLQNVPNIIKSTHDSVCKLCVYSTFIFYFGAVFSEKTAWWRIMFSTMINYGGHLIASIFHESEIIVICPILYPLSQVSWCDVRAIYDSSLAHHVSSLSLGNLWNSSL